MVTVTVASSSKPKTPTVAAHVYHYFPDTLMHVNIDYSTYFYDENNDDFLLNSFGRTTKVSELLNDPLYSVTDSYIQYLHNRFDNKTLSSWVVKYDPLSFTVNNQFQTQCFYRLCKETFKSLMNFVKENNTDAGYPFYPQEWLGVIEQGKTLHMHIVSFSNSLTKYLLPDIETYLRDHAYLLNCNCTLRHIREITVTPAQDPYGIIFDHSADLLEWTQQPSFVSQDTIVTTRINAIVTSEKIKSPTGYINYLQKNPILILHNTKAVGQYFVNFDRTRIFNPSSVAKFTRNLQNPIQSNNSLVNFLFRLFDNGVSDYQDVLRQNAIQSYLHLHNLKAIYQNCIQQYMCSNNIIDTLINLCNRYLDSNILTRCYCPMLEWLHHQNINVDLLQNELTIWMNGNRKKNTLLFIGQPNAGKSHIARLIWEQFPFHKRIIQDGIFTFANLINCGAALWEEPFIAPDLADTAKLVLEGTCDVEVAIKGQGSQKLNKRVPIIITTNNEIHRYCSGEAAAINARCVRFECNTVINPELSMCHADNHTCLSIGTSYSAVSCFERASGSSNKRRRTSSSSEETCSGLHQLTSNHMLCFLVHSLSRGKDLLEPFTFTPDIRDKEKQLLELLERIQADTNLCYLSRNHLLSSDL